MQKLVSLIPVLLSILQLDRDNMEILYFIRVQIFFQVWCLHLPDRTFPKFLPTEEFLQIVKYGDRVGQIFTNWDKYAHQLNVLHSSFLVTPLLLLKEFCQNIIGLVHSNIEHLIVV